MRPAHPNQRSTYRVDDGKGRLGRAGAAAGELIMSALFVFTACLVFQNGSYPLVRLALLATHCHSGILHVAQKKEEFARSENPDEQTQLLDVT